jgi:hypothetical protein
MDNLLKGHSLGALMAADLCVALLVRRLEDDFCFV